MKSDGLLFVMAVTMCLIVFVLGLLGAPLGSYGIPHSEWKTMLAGGVRQDGGAVVLLGWLFGVLLLIFKVGLLWFGMRARWSQAGRWISLGGAMYVLLWSFLVLSYAAFPDGLFFWGFPVSTSLMILGMWPFPMVFMALYYFGFDRWVYTKEDQLKFENLLEQREGKDHG